MNEVMNFMNMFDVLFGLYLYVSMKIVNEYVKIM